MAGQRCYMTTQQMIPRPGLDLDYARSLGLCDGYSQAHDVVDYLADNDFAVRNLAIVVTDLKSVERVTGRLTRGKVAVSGALSALWMGRAAPRREPRGGGGPPAGSRRRPKSGRRQQPGRPVRRSTRHVDARSPTIHAANVRLGSRLADVPRTPAWCWQPARRGLGARSWLHALNGTFGTSPGARRELVHD